MYNILTYTYLLLPLSIIVFRKKSRDSNVLLLGAYGIIAFFFLFFFDDVPTITKYQKLYAFSYTLIEYLVFAALIFSNISSKGARKFIIISSISFFVFQSIYFWTAKLEKLDSVPIGIETILLFIFIFIFFYESFNNPKLQYIYNDYCFWIAVGILIYLGGAFFIYILANEIHQNEIDKYWDLTYVAEIIKNILFCIAIYLYKPPLEKNLRNKSSIPNLDMI